MSITPKKLCIYFSYPSLVNGSNGNITSAVNVFKAYDQVIFAQAIASSSHPDHANTVNIISQLNPLGVKVYGEVDCNQTLSTIQTLVNEWQAMGAHIFCNLIGYDFGVSRSTQNQILNYIHGKNLHAFVSTWNSDDIFSSAINTIYNPTGTASAINSNDWYLAQSYQIVNGAYENVSEWTTRANKIAAYKQSFGTKMGCITTADSNNTFTQNMMDYAYFSTILYGFDSFGWGELNFSSSNALLPFRTRKTFYGTKLDSAININSSIYEIRTNIGIHIDTNAHTVNTLLTI